MMGKPKATKFGLGIKKFQYDDDDNLVHIAYLTIDGKPSSDGNNCPCVQLAYDEWGNRISEKYTDYAEKVLKALKANGIDATVNNRSEKIGFKIREARMDKLPYMLVVGQQEEADNTVSVRSRFAGDEGVKPLQQFIDDICKEIRTKEIRKEMPAE